MFEQIQYEVSVLGVSIKLCQFCLIVAPAFAFQVPLSKKKQASNFSSYLSSVLKKN